MATVIPLLSLLYSLAKVHQLISRCKISIQLRNILKIYREVELLVNLYNSTCEGHMTYTIYCLSSYAMVFALSIVIKYGHLLHLTMTLICSRIVFFNLVIVLEIDGNIKSE